MSGPILDSTPSGSRPSRAGGGGGSDGLGEWQSVNASNTLPELTRPALQMDMKEDEEEMIKFHEQIEQEEKELREAASAWAISRLPIHRLCNMQW